MAEFKVGDRVKLRHEATAGIVTAIGPEKVRFAAALASIEHID